MMLCLFFISLALLLFLNYPLSQTTPLSSLTFHTHHILTPHSSQVLYVPPPVQPVMWYLVSRFVLEFHLLHSGKRRVSHMTSDRVLVQFIYFSCRNLFNFFPCFFSILRPLLFFSLHSLSLSLSLSLSFSLFPPLSPSSLPPMLQEKALSILEFQPPFGDIKFGRFTGNVTIMRQVSCYVCTV